MGLAFPSTLLTSARQQLVAAPDSYLYLIAANEPNSSEELRIVQTVLAQKGFNVSDLSSTLPSGLRVIGVLSTSATRESAFKSFASVTDGFYILTVDAESEPVGTFYKDSKSQGDASKVRILSDNDVANAGELLAFHVSHRMEIFGSNGNEISSQLKEFADKLNTERSLVWQLEDANPRIIEHEKLLDEDDDVEVSSLLADENPLVQRKKAQNKFGASSSSSSSSNANIITNAIATLPIPEYAIEFTFLHRSSPPTDKQAGPTMRYAKPLSIIREVSVGFSVLHYASPSTKLSQLLTQLRAAMLQQIDRANAKIKATALPGQPGSGVTLQFRHFQPSLLHHAVTDVFFHSSSPKVQLFAGDTTGLFPPPVEGETHPSLLLTDAEKQLLVQRTKLHQLYSLPTNQPFFRLVNALYFPSEGASTNDPSQYITQPRLYNVHESLIKSSAIGGELSVISGRYGYYHYMQDRLNDDGWGCAYRTLQSICSWYILQGYTRSRPVPTHKDIQTILVAVKDKEPKFIGSKDWIGSTEVGLVLDYAYGVVTKTLFVSSGSEVDSHARAFRDHFRTQGTPIMIGGGVLAYGLLGIDYNEGSGEVRYLILDPHYTGADNLPAILKGGWIGWKKSDLFLADHFYNFAMPQRPKEAI